MAVFKTIVNTIGGSPEVSAVELNVFYVGPTNSREENGLRERERENGEKKTSIARED